MNILNSFRPRANAVANQVQGMGYENTDTYYKDCILEFLNIPNIHVMRESLNKMHLLCQSTVHIEEEKWFLKLDATHWYDYLRSIIMGARRTVQLLEENNCVLLHCSVIFFQFFFFVLENNKRNIRMDGTEQHKFHRLLNYC